MTATETTIQAPQESLAPHVYYSRHANLTICVNRGRLVLGTDNRSMTVDFKLAEFSGQANGFGQLITTDPETIAFLDRRMATVGDVFDPAKYNDLITPDAMKAKAALQDRDRLLTDNNRLLAKLDEMNRELAATKTVLASKK